MNLSTEIAGKKFAHCLMNASGVLCRTEEELISLLKSSCAAYVTKSATLEPRQGNPEPRYKDLPLGSINSMGLPNLGLDFYIDFVQSQSTEKPAFLSLAGLSLEENLEMLKKVQDSGFKGFVELNLSCPNLPGKPQTGYDFQRTEEVLNAVFKQYNQALGVKLPPYFDEVHFQNMANILNQFPLQFVTCINSIGNGLYIEVDTEEVVIKPKEGFGGLGGLYVKPTALANVRKFYTLLNKDIAIIGCGGISTGQDAFEHILCGASMLQIGTQLMKEGIGVFERIAQELSTLMEKKGYQSLQDFKGKLKSM